MRDERGLQVLPDGSILGPDGEVYRRTDQRLRRRSRGQELIDAGAVVVTDVYPDGMTWHEGVAAGRAWIEIAPRLVTGRRPNPVDLQWVCHIWESDKCHVLLRCDGQH